MADALVVVNEVPMGNTNVDGLFCAQDLAPDAVWVRLSSADCSTVWRFVQVVSDEVTTLKFTCLPTISTLLPDAVAGGTISGPDGFELVIPPNSIHMSGDPVIGTVDVRIGILNRPEDMLAAPGDMIATEPGGELFTLESYGMVEVTLTKNGQPVDFEGVATLTVPLAAGVPYAHGETVGLYYFDESTGLWRQEGLGTVDTQTTGAPLFVATVTHFSYWNCDEPLTDKNCFEGRVVDGNGDPAPGTQIELTGESYLYTTSTTADAAGHFCVDVKRGSLNHLTAFGAVGYQVGTWDATSVQAGSTATTCSMSGCTDLGDVVITPNPGTAVCP